MDLLGRALTHRERIKESSSLNNNSLVLKTVLKIYRDTSKRNLNFRKQKMEWLIEMDFKLSFHWLSGSHFLIPFENLL